MRIVALSGVSKQNGPELLAWADSPTITQGDGLKKKQVIETDQGGSF